MISLRTIKRLFTAPSRSLVAEPDEVVRPTRYPGDSVADALTPQGLMALLRAADQGDMQGQIQLFEAMEDRDAKLDGFMRQRKLGLLCKGWELQEPPQQSGSCAEIIEFCSAGLARIPGLNDRLFDLLDAIGKGFATLEVEWDVSENQWLPANLHWRPQSWFCLDEQGAALRLRSQEEPSFGEALNPLNWILHRHRARSGFDPRVGLYRSCARPFIIRNYGWKDWLAFAEIFGMPLRVGKLRQGATDDERDLMWRAIQSIGVDAAALIPEGSQIEFPTAGTGSGGNADIFERLIHHAEDDYVIAILGQRLTTDASGGSYALGKVHQAVRADIIQADAERLGETLTTQLLTAMVRLNFGPDAPVPRWHFNAEPVQDLAELAGVVKTLAEAGQPIPVRWVADTFRIPLPSDGEQALTGAAAARPAQAGPVEPTANKTLLDAIERARSLRRAWAASGDAPSPSRPGREE